MLDEAEYNPNFQAEKIAEAKKAGKGKKGKGQAKKKK